MGKAEMRLHLVTDNMIVTVERSKGPTKTNWDLSQVQTTAWLKRQLHDLRQVANQAISAFVTRRKGLQEEVASVECVHLCLAQSKL